ncbi:MAG: LacI family transcriptional regulator [Actinomycetospora sp.]|nr:LacI family transcriptional regulator [Actinomycetospora sp.]
MCVSQVKCAARSHGDSVTSGATRWSGRPSPASGFWNRFHTACHARVVTGDTAEPQGRVPLRAVARVTLDDVARRAGVSAATASRALGDHPHVAEATRHRVREAAAALDYVASPEASRLAGGPTGRVAVLVPHPSRWFFGELIEGLEAELRAAELDLVLFRVGGPEDRRDFFARLPARRKVDAVVVLAFAVDEAEHARLASLGVAVVAAGGRVASYPSVGIDDHRAGRRAVDHLLHLGHRRIGMLAGGDEQRLSPDPDGRSSAWRAALRDAGAEPDEELVATAPWSGEGGAEAMARLLGLSTPPTAVFAHCDEMALGAVRTLRRAGLRVPEDLSVIGIDDHPLAALTDLTTVAQPVREQGRRAGELVVDALRGSAPPRVPPAEMLPTHLVLRGTTAPPGAAR